MQNQRIQSDYTADANFERHIGVNNEIMFSIIFW